MRKEQGKPQGLACFYLHRYNAFRGRDPPYLWKALANRDLFQNLQIHAESGWRIP